MVFRIIIKIFTPQSQNTTNSNDVSLSKTDHDVNSKSMRICSNTNNIYIICNQLSSRNTTIGAFRNDLFTTRGGLFYRQFTVQIVIFDIRFDRSLTSALTACSVAGLWPQIHNMSRGEFESHFGEM